MAVMKALNVSAGPLEELRNAAGGPIYASILCRARDQITLMSSSLKVRGRVIRFREASIKHFFHFYSPRLKCTGAICMH